MKLKNLTRVDLVLLLNAVRLARKSRIPGSETYAHCNKLIQMLNSKLYKSVPVESCNVPHPKYDEQNCILDEDHKNLHEDSEGNTWKGRPN